MKEHIKQFVRKYAPSGLIIMVQEVRQTRCRIYTRKLLETRYQESRGCISRLLEKKENIYLEIGAGGKKGENGWTTLDLTEGCDIYWDFHMGLPFPNGSVHRIYSSHLLEHFAFRQIQKLLYECLRILSPGGTFSVCVPNARIYILAYSRNENLDQKEFFGYTPAFNYNSRIDYVNYTAYMDGQHKYMFDEENLVSILRNVGFRNVRLRDFDPTIDLKERHPQSIYAVGEK